jgi:hypothetical protein
MQDENILEHAQRSKFTFIVLLLSLFSIFFISTAKNTWAKNTFPLSIYQNGQSVIADITEIRISGVVNIASTSRPSLPPLTVH